MPYKSKERQKLYSKKWYEENRERVRKYSKKWRSENKEHLNEYMRNYMRERYKKNPEKACAQSRKRQAKYNKKLREGVIQQLGGKCVVCDINDIRVLQVDHIHGKGAEERRTLSGTKIYRKIRDMENPESEYQLLCANHNWIKRYELEEHGHGINTK